MVTVERAPAMRKMDSLGKGHHTSRSIHLGQRVMPDRCGEALALDEVHGVVVQSVLFTDLMDADNIGMLQPRGGRRFSTEAANFVIRCQQTRSHHFDGNCAVETHLARLVHHVMGTYRKNVGFETFVETKFGHSEHRNDLAALAGAVRMVTAEESSDGHHLDEAIIKAVTGGNDSVITCREIRGKPFSYAPQYKPWFMSNYEPVIKGGDWGIWRRVKKIPWNYTLAPVEKTRTSARS
jgi:hypothetical protein